MKAAAARHAGLPFVPQPASSELLGSWRLRFVQLYGLGLKTLLSRLGARPAGDAHLPHWFAIGGSTVSLDALSVATRLPRVDLAAMAPPSSRPRWPEELGACERCLADATKAGHHDHVESDLGEPIGPCAASTAPGSLRLPHARWRASVTLRTSAASFSRSRRRRHRSTTSLIAPLMPSGCRAAALRGQPCVCPGERPRCTT